MIDIKKVRENRGLTQQELADLLGVSRKTIVNYESGGNIPETKEKIFAKILSNNTHEDNPIKEDDLNDRVKTLEMTVKGMRDDILEMYRLITGLQSSIIKESKRESKNKNSG